jgi:hypothetical protein
MELNEKRAYLRGNCFCDAEIIVDEDFGEKEDVSVIDLAAGGLKFTAEDSNVELKIGEIHPIRLSIHESDINIPEINAAVKICRSELDGGGVRLYGASFVDLTESQEIRIDEILQHKKRMLKKYDM